MKQRRIYNIRQIVGACVIASPIPAGILIAHNYWVLGEKRKSIFWIFAGIIWTLALVGIGFIIPENLTKIAGILMPEINGLILYPIIKRIQGAKIEEHLRNNGKAGSYWVLAGVIILFVSLLITPIIILTKNDLQKKYLRQGFNQNGIFYNPEMQLDEVDKLGNILQRINYFNDTNLAEVVFLSHDSVYEFKLITEKSFFKDSVYINEVRQLFKHVGSYNFKKPIRFKITDQYLKKDQEITLSNYDQIAILMESEVFARNKNFKLIFDMSFDKPERERLQRLILSNNKLFPPQKGLDFMVEVNTDEYIFRLFIPKQFWDQPQLINELKTFRHILNSSGFKFPFLIILMDDTQKTVLEKEID
jgi:hypothetical protein